MISQSRAGVRASGPAIIVTSADLARRRDWARVFEEDGVRVAQCSGPLIDCPLARGETRCRLLEESELAVYDIDSLLPTFFPTLLRAYPHRSFLFARDALAAGGRHRPSVRRFVLARGRSGGPCFGTF